MLPLSKWENQDKSHSRGRELLEKMSTDRLDLQRSELVEVRKTMKELRDRLDDLRARWEANGLPIKK